MIKSMYSGISGMNAQQKKLDVIGNNIANSGTTAFKTSSVTFQDAMRETISKGSGPILALGGSNPKQIGMGVQLQSINVNTGQGSLNPTGRPLDMAIDGIGNYFLVSKGAVDSSINLGDDWTIEKGDEDVATGDTYYTRDGQFKLDSYGNLVTTNGYRVMGYMPDGIERNVTDGKITLTAGDENMDGSTVKFDTNGKKLVPLAIPEKVGEHRVSNFSIEKDGMIKATLENQQVVIIGQIGMASFVNDEGLIAQGNNMYTPGVNSGKPIIRSHKNAGDTSNEKTYGDVLQGMLEMSNVDLAVEFTEMIVASRSFQACSKVITTGDEILQELVNLKR